MATGRYLSLLRVTTPLFCVFFCALLAGEAYPFAPSTPPLLLDSAIVGFIGPSDFAKSSIVTIADDRSGKFLTAFIPDQNGRFFANIPPGSYKATVFSGSKEIGYGQFKVEAGECSHFYYELNWGNNFLQRIWWVIKENYLVSALISIFGVLITFVWKNYNAKKRFSKIFCKQISSRLKVVYDHLISSTTTIDKTQAYDELLGLVLSLHEFYKSIVAIFSSIISGASKEDQEYIVEVGDLISSFKGYLTAKDNENKTNQIKALSSKEIYTLKTNIQEYKIMNSLIRLMGIGGQ